MKAKNIVVGIRVKVKNSSPMDQANIQTKFLKSVVGLLFARVVVTIRTVLVVLSHELIVVEMLGWGLIVVSIVLVQMEHGVQAQPDWQLFGM